MPGPLDNPIWRALTGNQQHLAEGDTLARRFPYDIGPLCGLIEQSEAAYRSLAALARPGEPMVLFLDVPAHPPAEWTVQVSGPLTQMVREHAEVPQVEASGFAIEELTIADVPEMLALTRLTRPGPFRERTIELGGYYGIREAGRLVAMAGERLRVDGCTEVSAVCTHPDFQGRGHARRLMSAVMHNIMQRGEVPFLHAWAENDNAVRLYEKLGFRHRRIIHVGVLRLGEASEQ